MKNKLQSINFPIELLESIKILSDQERRSFSAQVVFMLQQYLEAQKAGK